MDFQKIAEEAFIDELQKMANEYDPNIGSKTFFSKINKPKAIVNKPGFLKRVGQVADKAFKAIIPESAGQIGRIVGSSHIR